MGDFFGLGGSSDKSSTSTSTTSTTNNNIDRRQVISGGVGVTSDGAPLTINASTSDPAVVTAALDAITASDATNGQGFTALLTLADKLFSSTGSMIDKTQTASLAQLETLNTAANDKAGTIDQKTIMVLGGLAVAAFAFGSKK